jgi:hypothetical protein
MATSPRPWSFREPGKWPENADAGAFVDAGGKDVCWFGNAEQYYPTEGTPPSDDDIALILKAVNEYIEP